MKVGLVYDHEQRPETTGFYCRRALGKLVDVEHLVPQELELVNPSIFDLFVFVDDGLDYNIPAHWRPRAAWAIDTHINMTRSVERFGDAEFLFAAQQNGAKALQQLTNRVVHWLPLACDPDIHHHMSGETKCHDLGFVGNPVGTDRQRLLGMLAARYPSSWFGKALFEDMCRMYSRCRIGFNCSVADDLNMRLFEVPACHLPLVTNHIEDNGLEQLFEVGRHLLTFRSDDQLMEMIDRLLSDCDFAERLARDGHQHVLQHHTYSQRMSNLLKAAHVTKSSVAVRGKSGDYFEFDRPDVRSLIPKCAERILDIGCASGRLGQCLKSDRACHVTGVEADAIAVATASRRLDRVVESPIEALAESFFEPAAFDCIVLADVLEHLRCPDAVLHKCRYWLSDNGSLVISVPNSRHHSVVSGLLEGNWTYERAGLLDEDHVRCFTRRELEKLLYRAGFDVCNRVSISAPGSENWKQLAAEGTVQIGNLLMSGLSVADAEEFHTYQLLVQAQKRSRPSFGLTSIIIATFNQLWATRLCVDSLLKRTDEEIELIFVDNGSTDGTPEYLDSIPGARVIRNNTNRGFAKAVNQGLQIATGEQLLLLNNDCVVTTGWLNGLLETLYDDDANGLVGPVSNNVSGTQQIPVSYRLLTSVDGFAWDRRGCRNLTVTDRLVGFCLLFRRDVMNRIGMLDEQFEVGCFEDDDFCRRALLAGYRAIIANHVYIHHFGSVTFEGAGFDLHDILIHNERKYEEKWSQFGGTVTPSPPVADAVPDAADLYPGYQLHGLSDGSALLQRRQIRLSLCMIVRDNEDTIEACLDSIYPWVDEIIIVDTGSQDRTPEICRAFGARIFEFPWCDDFSAARNKSLEPARGEWLFWMDSDDVIDQEQGRRLRELVYGEHEPHCLGYVMQVHCISEDPDQKTVVDHVKVFRNRSELRFELRIHEQILPAIRRTGGVVKFTDVFVTHVGAIQTPELRQRKLDRDFRILRLDLAEHPNHPFVLFNLGMTHEDAGQYLEAAEYLRKSICAAEPDESHLRKAWALLVNCESSLGELTSAIGTATTALTFFPEDPELLFRRGCLYQSAGCPSEAANDYLMLMNSIRTRTFQSVDPAIWGYKLSQNMAIVSEQSGDLNNAISWWQKASVEAPGQPAVWDGLVRCCLKAGCLAQAEAAIHEIPSVRHLTGIRLLLGSLCMEARGRFSDAQLALEQAWTDYASVECLNELARILCERGEFHNCLHWLEQLKEADPLNAAVWHNLGQAYWFTGNLQAARICLGESIRIRPDSAATNRLLQEIEGTLAP